MEKKSNNDLPLVPGGRATGQLSRVVVGGTACWAAPSVSLVPGPGISPPAGKSQHPDCLLTRQLSSMPPPGSGLPEVFHTVFSLVTLGSLFFLPRKEDNRHSGSLVLNVTPETSSSGSLPAVLMGSGSQGPAQGESSTCTPAPSHPTAEASRGREVT